MTDELIALLKELNAANEKGCKACNGEGYIEIESSSKELGYVMPKEHCPTCQGTGAKVPELNRMEWFWALKNGKEPKKYLRNGYETWLENLAGCEILPAPTVEELLEMLPGSINHCGIEYYFTLLKSGNFYSASYYSSRVDAVQTIQFNFKSPLIALLRLMLWWIKQ